MNWSSILCDLNAARFVEARYLSIVLATDAASCLFLCQSADVKEEHSAAKGEGEGLLSSLRYSYLSNSTESVLLVNNVTAFNPTKLLNSANIQD
jgi:hypothetical protein